ncbi:hypothetical protein DL239_12620 [Sedimentitalea sp. CY04]|uniref:Uncharacterized protein n=1 Tax=Parasedimentitalea denitrificans TaxID=2211118 RepID=A0ABX0WC97_9RHOB|nr:hypothetical protein [Sedimentitalea sp. CY04]
MLELWLVQGAYDLVTLDRGGQGQGAGSAGEVQKAPAQLGPVKLPIVKENPGRTDRGFLTYNQGADHP